MHYPMKILKQACLSLQDLVQFPLQSPQVQTIMAGNAGTASRKYI